MKTKKRFGQNLLTDKSYLNKIVNSLELNKDDMILEIGAGSGLLTVLLSQHVKKVYAVELERDIVKELEKKLKDEKITNVEIIESDFLKLDLDKLTQPLIRIVGNIPYNITSKILLKLFGEIDNPSKCLKLLKSVHLMMQYEVAKRLVAKPNSKEYSPISLLIQFFSDPKILFNVPRSAFHPIPKVDSAFVGFKLKNNLPEVKDPALLKNIIRTAFQQRRKKAINALNKLPRDKSILENVFDRLKLDHNLRAENLSFDDFLALSNML